MISEDCGGGGPIYFVVQGLFEKSDSIGYDCVHQFQTLAGEAAGASVRLFAETFDASRYPGVPIEPVERLYRLIDSGARGALIYHYCDGWKALEDRLPRYRGRLVVRWHNNTPPWFFGAYAQGATERTVRGFENILALALACACEFWVNSAYSARQLAVLGVRPDHIRVVFPASRYLSPVEPPASEAAATAPDPDRITLLFVGRVTPHKGFKHMILTAARLKAMWPGDVRVLCPGRTDPTMWRYVEELEALAATFGVELEMPGEIDEAALREAYAAASVLLYLSEHEGFGLPVFEAMRMGAPVVAWANTAVREALAGHPYAFADLDPGLFAQAVMELRDPERRRAVVDLQTREFLPRYTGEGVGRQLREALAAPAPWGSALADDREGVPAEIPDNLVTLHDLKSYRMLLSQGLGGLSASVADEGEARRGLRFDQTASSVGVKLGAAYFSSLAGRLTERGLVCPLKLDQGHAVFGPYFSLEAGTYRVEFDFAVSDDAAPPRAHLVIDAVGEDGAVLARHRLDRKLFAASKSRFLSFELDHDMSQIEFRVEPRGFSAGELVFRGVYLARMTPLLSLEMRGDERWRSAQARHARGRRLFRLPLYVVDLVGSSEGLLIRKGRLFRPRAFAAADRARNARDWSEAARLYRRGLRRDAGNFAGWVQLGHALKEQGDLAGAEEAYLAALALDPFEPDLLLNIGHLLKMQGRSAEATSFYIRALEVDRVASDSVKELLELGLEPLRIAALARGGATAS